MNTTPQEVTQLADDLRRLHLLCETPADFADVEAILAGLDDEQRSLYWTTGYTAYCNGKGPGRGRENALGWLVLCETPADFADVEAILAGLDDEQRSLYWTTGYTAYCNGKGPGRGRENALGWLAAHHDAVIEVAERAIDRAHEEAVRFGLL